MGIFLFKEGIIATFSMNYLNQGNPMSGLQSLLPLRILCWWLLLLILVAPAVHAEVIDRIQINRSDDEAEIQIFFVTRIQFIRQAMLKNGDIRLYFNLLETDTADKRPVKQRRESPPSSLVPHFTLTYPEIDSSLTISFTRRVDNYYIRPGTDGRSISFFTPIQPAAREPSGAPSAITLAPPAPAAPAVPALAQPKTQEEHDLIEAEAKQLMINAQGALQSNLIPAYAAILRKLVDLPANQQSQTALMMLAKAHEQLSEATKARDEYDLYIKLYPKAKDIAQAKEGLGRVFMAAYLATHSEPERLAVTDTTITFGGFSQYYYKGLLHTDTTSAGTTMLLDSNDQSSLLSSLDITSMRRSATRETRMVLRDSFTANFLASSGNYNFLDAAYIEQASANQSYYYGLGRQTGASGGVPSRFDGAWLGYNFNTAWRISGTAGSPVQLSGINAERKTFAALNLNLSRQPGLWSGNLYTIAQRISHTLDRRVAGLEARYFDGRRNQSVLLEYDTLFKRTGIGLLQSNWMTADDRSYTLLMNHRYLPALQTSNALLIYPTGSQSINGLLQVGTTPDQLHDRALLNTPILNQLNIGTTQPLSARLKLGGDLKLANTTPYTAYDVSNAVTTAFPRVGSVTYSAQLIGNSLLFDNDLGIASASYTHASTYKAEALSFSQTESFRDNWRLDLSLLLYAENNELTGSTRRANPSFRLSYRRSDTLNFEINGGLTQARVTSTSADTKLRRRYFSLGYRWDFR
jgi:hypothetical protein